MPDRTDAEHNHTRILETAAAALAEDGDVSLNSIAKRAGVGPGTLYRHFPAREALVLAVGAVADRWGCEVRWWRGERIVTVEDNYDNLGYGTGDITRDSRYTRYVDDHRMLRSHTSALIPAALRALATDPAGDVLLACPGIVHRRDRTGCTPALPTSSTCGASPAGSG
ncbi:TetR/AcrR family transcriptional regulator [Amycolatopsis sp. FDAARGOS 1241]|uniref:TetR/AcrR family transcriptional regulator n=1 Tax=Amycolatopsis sp. FDAARGOS 1241 TaxID=2778070 RepID=UPI001951B7CA|nr:TetR family transcriptional regulator [Amycolatopsis sp. FDAARGOS 1241]QRP43447.1 TetR family transcriptional regulator [Amycolatopsis sp. FDAARGOS 1241]